MIITHYILQESCECEGSYIWPNRWRDIIIFEATHEKEIMEHLKMCEGNCSNRIFRIVGICTLEGEK